MSRESGAVEVDQARSVPNTCPILTSTAPCRGALPIGNQQHANGPRPDQAPRKHRLRQQRGIEKVAIRGSMPRSPDQSSKTAIPLSLLRGKGRVMVVVEVSLAR